jgi:hypothetical protein
MIIKQVWWGFRLVETVDEKNIQGNKNGLELFGGEICLCVSDPRVYSLVESPASRRSRVPTLQTASEGGAC